MLIKISEGSDWTKVYPVFGGGNSYSFKINTDKGNGFVLNGELNELVDVIKDTFGNNVSQTDIAHALAKKGRGAFFEITRSEEIVIKAFQKIEDTFVADRYESKQGKITC